MTAPDVARAKALARLYQILRAIQATPEPSSGVRVGALSYNETVAYDAIASLLAEYAAAAVAEEREALRAVVYCPGHWRCAVCGFYNVRATISMSTGTIGIGSLADLCPNDGALMQPVKWSAVAEDQRAGSEMKREEDEALYHRVVACLHRHGQTGSDANVVDTLITYTDDVASALSTKESRTQMILAELKVMRVALERLAAWSDTVAFRSDEGIAATGQARGVLRADSPAAPRRAGGEG